MFLSLSQRWNIKPETILKIIGIGWLTLWLAGKIPTFKSLIIVLIAGFVLALLTEPIVAFLERKKIHRIIGSAFVITIFLAFLGFISSQLLPLILQQTIQVIQKLIQFISNFQSGQIPHGLEFLQNYESQLQQAISNKIASTGLQATQYVGGATTFLFSTLLSIFGSAFSFILFIIVSLFFLQKPKTLENFLKPLMKQEKVNEVLRVLELIRKKMGKWLVGQTLLAGLMAVAVFIILTILKVPFALTIAIAGFLAEYTPYIGILVIGSVALPVLLEKGPTVLLIFYVSYVACNWTKENILVPLVMRKIVGLHPLVIFISMLVCAELIGVVGILLAVPIATIVKILIDEYTELSKPQESKLPENPPV